MKRKYLLLFITTALVGCATVYNIPQYSSVFTTKKGSSPELEDTSSVYVGSSIYTEFNYTVIPTIKLKQELKNGEIDFPANSQLMALRENNRIIYTSSSLNLGDYLADFNNDNHIDHIKTKENILKDWSVLKNPVSYVDGKSIKSKSSKGYQFQLLYEGKSKNSIKILYREYKDNLARPAFTQKVDYDLKENDNTEIVFKGAKIIVIAATSNKLTYKVIQGFNINS